MMKNLRISYLLFAGVVVFVGCKDPETMTTTAQGATSSADDSATSTTAGSATDGSATDGSATDGSAADGSASASTTAGSESASASGSGTTTDSDTTGAETDCSFLSCKDGGGPGTSECDIWAQDCPDGEKCMPWANDGGGSWNALKCSPVDANPSQSGDECVAEGGGVSGVDNCDLGLLCWYVNEENIGSCIDQCMGTEDAPICPSGTVCDVTNDGVLTLCLPTCDPLLVDCPGDQICFFSNLAGDFICDFDASGEAGAYGDPCEYVNVCDPGLWCAAAENVPGCEAGGCCSEYCDINEGNTCSGQDMGQDCVPWFDMGAAPPGLDHVGACVVP